MSQFCVFCGNKPQGKNAEHVLPQWLMAMTGKKSRPCFMGNILPSGRDSIAFQALKFPACEECNSRYSLMEAQCKDIITKIMDGASLTAPEISLLLDWFDKVRVGLWLGDLYLSKQVDVYDPHMHIASRVGLKDRMLIIERTEPKEDEKIRLSFIGPGMKTFRHMPSVFQLIVNDYTFTSASEYGLVARRVGFPYCDKMIFMDLTDIRPGTVNRGNGRLHTPVVRSFEPTKTQTVIYQPMYRGFSLLSPEPYNVKYVQDHSLDAENGVGGIFYQKGGRPTAYLDANAQLNVTPRITTGQDACDMSVKLFQLHNHIIDNTYTAKLATPDVQREREWTDTALKAANNTYIDMCRNRKDVVISASSPKSR